MSESPTPLRSFFIEDMICIFMGSTIALFNLSVLFLSYLEISVTAALTGCLVVSGLVCAGLAVSG